MLNDIIDERSSRMDIATYSTIMKVKFGLFAEANHPRPTSSIGE